NHTHGNAGGTCYHALERLWVKKPFRTEHTPVWRLRLTDAACNTHPAGLLTLGQSNQTGYAYWTCWPSSIEIHRHLLHSPWPCPRSPPAQVLLRTRVGSGVGRVPQAAW